MGDLYNNRRKIVHFINPREVDNSPAK